MRAFWMTLWMYGWFSCYKVRSAILDLVMLSVTKSHKSPGVKVIIAGCLTTQPIISWDVHCCMRNTWGITISHCTMPISKEIIRSLYQNMPKYTSGMLIVMHFMVVNFLSLNLLFYITIIWWLYEWSSPEISIYPT